MVNRLNSRHNCRHNRPTENAKHGRFSIYDSSEPYWKHTVKDNSVDLTIGMLNDYAVTVPGMPLISPQEQLQQLLKYYPVVVVGTAVAQQSTLTPNKSYIVSDWSGQGNAGS